MRPEFFGDSYDIVKRFLIKNLSSFGPWTVHPMFTSNAARIAGSFSDFLRAPLASTAVLSSKSARAESIQKCRGTGNLFLDPDTGVFCKKAPNSPSRKHVYAEELVDLVLARRGSLTAVYDQSFRRGDVRAQLKRKLWYFGRRRVIGFAYQSHACFLVLAANVGIVREAKERLLAVGLPSNRLIGPI